ncbi:MAG: glycosyltransferase [Spirochaetes bacterium]|nr:glycosyltransferase [Spirochaetota bacterium]
MLSIIVPTFNEEDFLPRLLASIESQDFTDREVIVADNRSRDRTRAVARSHGARVVSGGTPAVGRNRGAATARGEYLMFLDADVVLPEGFLARILHRFDEEFVDICIPWIRPVDGSKAIYRTIYQFSNTYYKLMEVLQPQGLGVCILVTRRLHERIGGFTESRRVSEDFDYISRAGKVGRFRVFPSVHVYHSVRRYVAEGVGPLVQKQFASGMLYLLTGKAVEVPDYEFGTFSYKLLEERPGRRPGRDRREVTRLLSTFSEQGRRLQSQMERLEAGAPRTRRQKTGDRRRPSPGR